MAHCSLFWNQVVKQSASLYTSISSGLSLGLEFCGVLYMAATGLWVVKRVPSLQSCSLPHHVVYFNSKLLMLLECSPNYRA